jgi:creatine kinase
MERDWPEGRGIFHNEAKTFLVWVNEEDQLRIISMEKGGDVKKVFERLAAGIEAVEKSIKEESGKTFLLDEKLGYLHSCPTNLGTGMRYDFFLFSFFPFNVKIFHIRNVLIGAK